MSPNRFPLSRVHTHFASMFTLDVAFFLLSIPTCALVLVVFMLLLAFLVHVVVVVVDLCCGQHSSSIWMRTHSFAANSECAQINEIQNERHIFVVILWAVLKLYLSVCLSDSLSVSLSVSLWLFVYTLVALLLKPLMRIYCKWRKIHKVSHQMLTSCCSPSIRLALIIPPPSPPSPSGILCLSNQPPDRRKLIAIRIQFINMAQL